jgi:hypothetical protein
VLDEPRNPVDRLGSILDGRTESSPIDDALLDVKLI